MQQLSLRFLPVLLPLAGQRCSASCSFVEVGCFQDGGGTNAGSVEPGCSDCSADKRILRYNLKNCPEDKWYPTLPPATPPSPTCDPALVNIEYCAGKCAAWMGWEVFFIGLESGVDVPKAKPNYAECTCDTQPPTSALLGADKCPAKCPGSPSSTDRCGGAPGAWTSSVYHVDCSSVWGATFLGALALGLGSYLAAGIFLGRARSSVKMWERHPHYPRWQAGMALALDGVAFARGGRARHGTRDSGKEQLLLLTNRGGSGGGSISGSQKKEGKKQHKKEHKKEQKPKTASSMHSKGKQPRTNSSSTAAAVTGSSSRVDATDAPDATKSTTSGGGGRWIHVPA
jgi:hypothetical protein